MALWPTVLSRAYRWIEYAASKGSRAPRSDDSRLSENDAQSGRFGVNTFRPAADVQHIGGMSRKRIPSLGRPPEPLRFWKVSRRRLPGWSFFCRMKSPQIHLRVPERLDAELAEQGIKR